MPHGSSEPPGASRCQVDAEGTAQPIPLSAPSRKAVQVFWWSSRAPVVPGRELVVVVVLLLLHRGSLRYTVRRLHHCLEFTLVKEVLGIHGVVAVVDHGMHHCRHGRLC